MSQENIFKAQWRMRERQRAEQAEADRAAQAALDLKVAEAEQRARTEELRFEAEEGVRRARAREKAAALAIQRAPVLQRIQAKEQRDALFQGTPPSMVWGEKAGKLCKDFIEFMGEFNFRGATNLTYGPFVHNPERPGRTQKSMKGFGVGAMVAGVKTYTSLTHNVFLCEDNQLRIYTSDPIQTGCGQAAQKTSWRIPTEAARKSLYGYGLNLYILASLPVDNEGYTIIPPVGNLSYKDVPAVYEEGRLLYSTGSHYSDELGGPSDYKAHYEEKLVSGGYVATTFTPANLEGMLHSHARSV